MSGLTNLELAGLLYRRLNELLVEGSVDGRFIADVLGIVVANCADQLSDKSIETKQQFVATVAHVALENIEAFDAGDFQTINTAAQ